MPEYSTTLDEAGCARHRPFDSLETAVKEARTLSREYKTFVSVHVDGHRIYQYYCGKRRSF